MQKLSASVVCAALGVTLLAGCSSNTGLFGNSLTTQSIGMAGSGTATPTPVANKVDPACYSLSQRIDMLRKEGVTERLEKASVGKSSTVAVKRASLAQAAELDKANADFQARCSSFGPRPIQAAAPIATGSVVAAAPVANSSQVVPATAPKAAIAPPVVQQQ